jgi:hypothetical protein
METGTFHQFGASGLIEHGAAACHRNGAMSGHALLIESEPETGRAEDIVAKGF